MSLKISWETIYKQQASRLLGLYRCYVRDAQIAEDWLHDAFTTAMQKQQQFKGKGSVEGWLRTIILLTRTTDEISRLQKASLKEVISNSNASKILFFPEQETATFLTSDILLADNQLKNIIEMKKVSFIGVIDIRKLHMGISWIDRQD